MNIKIAAAGFAVASLALVGCSSGESTSESTPSPAATSAEASPTAAAEAGTIVEVASGNPDFSTLVAAVSAAGLAETLSAEGPYTVFAPTNEAFEALPAGLLDELLKPENKEVLTQILTYHVVAGEVMSTDIEPGDVPTVEGEDLTVAVTDGTVTVNGATVEAADVEASNGVIHVIDEVLVPPNVDVAALTG
ncbi:MAG: fasciclin domain-containing protein [Actinobacteria bacterium]|nr:fasciclin domain-containing protein [Actinomycetota bacterium]MCB8997795.1 fasciclin domain-containing protein [Actinomycetota bacterium]MCB9414311.1 fasciclin domain-containing protein [Actinomycetota bacterium]MCB9424056.1 fasciclin domain-containing protein [Actinomycetota bacterium]HRY09076.1 fasciclin domain-containing protein [Candidatus Nanopelagicales bacterium]